jgi:hypothetical protein
VRRLYKSFSVKGLMKTPDVEFSQKSVRRNRAVTCRHRKDIRSENRHDKASDQLFSSCVKVVIKEIQEVSINDVDGVPCTIFGCCKHGSQFLNSVCLPKRYGLVPLFQQARKS